MDLSSNIIPVKTKHDYDNFLEMLDYYLNNQFSLDIDRKKNFVDWEDLAIITLTSFNLFLQAKIDPEQNNISWELCTFDDSQVSRYLDNIVYSSPSLNLMRNHPINNYHLNQDNFKHYLDIATNNLLICRDIQNPSLDEIEFYNAVVICIINTTFDRLLNFSLFPYNRIRRNIDKHKDKPIGVFRYAKLLHIKAERNLYKNYLPNKKIR